MVYRILGLKYGVGGTQFFEGLLDKKTKTLGT